MKSGAKILITGLSNTGKTSLTKNLKDAFVVSRDGKPYPFPVPHWNVQDYEDVNELLDNLVKKVSAYKAKFGKLPSTIVFDSVSRIFTDIENNCEKKFIGFESWKNINKEMSIFTNNINDMISNGFNIVLIAHSTWDEKAGKFTETCKGSFAKTGGFLSTVDYAINVDVENKKYWLTHRGNSLSRTLIEDIPDKQLAIEFNLQEYIDKIHDKAQEITDRWSL